MPSVIFVHQWDQFQRLLVNRDKYQPDSLNSTSVNIVLLVIRGTTLQTCVRYESWPLLKRGDVLEGAMCSCQDKFGLFRT